MIIKVNYTVSDVYMSTSISPVYIKVVYSGVSGGGGTWGTITGTLSDQTDLQDALDDKVPYTGATSAVNLGAYDLTVNSLTVGKGANGIATNTALGISNLASVTSATYNTAIGVNSLQFLTTGNFNTALGGRTLFLNSVGVGNTAIGIYSLYNSTNDFNTALGASSGQSLTTGTYNTFVGKQAGFAITTGDKNIVISSRTTGGTGIITGSYNTILGNEVSGLTSTTSNNIILADGQGNIRFRDDATNTILSRLQGTGLRMVTASTNGELSTQAIPTLTSGGYSLSYYLNGGTAASVGTYYQMSKTAVLGTGVDFTLVGNGLISQFLTDVSDPNRLEIPGGNWNFEMYFSISSSGGNTAFYVELLKYNGSTFTSIASSVSTPEEITNGTTIDVYTTSLAIPQTTLLATDRLALRVYIVNNSGGRTVTLHTQDSHLCEIITNFAGGVSALNGLTANTQYFATGTSGTNFAIVSSGDTHTFNLPTASATNRGALSSADWTIFYNKQASLTLTTTGTSGAATLVGSTLNIPQYSGGGGMAIGGAITSATAGSVLFAGVGGILQQDNANLFWDDANNMLGIGTAAPLSTLHINGTSRFVGSSFTNYITAAGRLLLGTATESTYLLDVNGTARVSGDLNMTGNIAFPTHNTYSIGSFNQRAAGVYAERFYTGGSSANTLGIAGFSTTVGLTISLNAYNNANSSAILELIATTRGFLPPRMTTTQRDAIATPATGLVVYNTTLNSTDTFDGARWRTDAETITTNRQTASYSLVLADRGKLIEMNVATANNLTVPLNSSIAFPIGSKIDIVQYGAGQTTIVATGGVTVRSAGGALKLALQYSGASLVKIATDEWYLFGNITV